MATEFKTGERYMFAVQGEAQTYCVCQEVTKDSARLFVINGGYHLTVHHVKDVPSHVSGDYNDVMEWFNQEKIGGR